MNTQVKYVVRQVFFIGLIVVSIGPRVCSIPSCSTDSLTKLLLIDFRSPSTDSLVAAETDCLSQSDGTSWDSALIAYAREDWAKATERFDRLIVDKSSEQESRGLCYFMRSQCMANSGNAARCLVDLESTIVLLPHLSPALSNKSYLLTSGGKPNEGLKFADSAIASDSNNCRAWNNKGFALAKLNRLEEATTCFEKSVRLQPTFDEGNFNLGISKLDLKDYSGAIACFDRTISTNHTFGQAWFNRGRAILLRSGDYSRLGLESYLESIDSALSFGFRSAEIWTQRGLILGNMERYEEAIASFDSVLVRDKQNYWIMNKRSAAVKLLTEQRK